MFFQIIMNYNTQQKEKSDFNSNLFSCLSALKKTLKNIYININGA